MKRTRVTQGQTMVIVALSILALVAVVALAVDGGSVLLQRRNMQNGADSGALAAVGYLQQNIAATCNPTPCHPQALVTNGDVISRTNTFVAANRGGVVGSASYTTTLEYHFTDGPNAGTYQNAANYSTAALVPAFADGVRVTAGINNPTIFAQAIGIRILPASAQAAARLYPTCRVVPSDGPTLPFTRFRPPMDARLADPNVRNDLCNPFLFWDSGGDFQSSNFDNLISLNQNSFHPVNGNITQTITLPDYRHWPTDTLGMYSHAQGNPPYLPCVAGTNCADMRGSGQQTGSPATQDAGNWIFWQWNGILSIHSLYPASTETRNPATRNNNGGQTGGTNRYGDWAEVFTGNFGQTVQEALHDLANQ